MYIGAAKASLDDPGQAGDGARTRDIQLGRLTLYPLSYAREPDAPHGNSGMPDGGMPVMVGVGFEPT